MQTKQDATGQIRRQLKKVRNKHQHHIQHVNETPSGDILIRLKPRRHEDYQGFQSRPDLEIGLAVSEALKDVDGSLYKVSKKSKGFKVSTRPFDVDFHNEVL